MPAYASLEELTKVNQNLQELEQKYPEAYVEFSKLFKSNKKIGYKNICKLLMKETTPQELKGM